MSPMIRARTLAVALLVGLLIVGCEGQATGATEPPGVQPFIPAATSAPTATPALVVATPSDQPASATPTGAPPRPMHMATPKPMPVY